MAESLRERLARIRQESAAVQEPIAKPSPPCLIDRRTALLMYSAFRNSPYRHHYSKFKDLLNWLGYDTGKSRDLLTHPINAYELYCIADILKEPASEVLIDMLRIEEGKISH